MYLGRIASMFHVAVELRQRAAGPSCRRLAINFVRNGRVKNLRLFRTAAERRAQSRTTVGQMLKSSWRGPVSIRRDSAIVMIYTAAQTARHVKVFWQSIEELMKANRKITIAALAGIVLSVLSIVVPGNAAIAQDTVRVRGTIESIDGPTYLIKTRDGDELKVALSDKAQIAAVVKASLADIKQGVFVGVSAMPQADGSQSALEVHIFPEVMRGTGEGHYSWDLRPKSTMTNANVDQVVTAVDGQTLTLKYKDGEKTIFVAGDTPIVAYVRGDTNDLRAGAKVFIAAIKQPDGTLQGRAWRVGRDGVTPPM